jgi:hypothetical protein
MSKEDNTPSSLHSRDDRYTDEATQKRIREHLADPNSKITEEDIANVNTDIFKRPPTEEEKKADEKEIDESLPPKAGSSWDVMG